MKDIKKTQKEPITWMSRHKLFCVILLIIAFVLPVVIINLLFKWDSGCFFLQAEWSAGEALVYVAGFETFLGTSLLSILSIWQNKKFKEENDLTTKRYIELESEKIRLANMPQFIIQSVDNKKIVREIKNVNGADIAILDFIKTHGFFVDETNSCFWTPSKNDVGIDVSMVNNFLSIFNCGNNTAHQVKLKMLINGVEYSDEKTTSIKKDDDIFFYLGINNLSDNVDMILKIRYFDSFQNVYEQQFPIKNIDGQLNFTSYSDVKLVKKNDSLNFQY